MLRNTMGLIIADHNRVHLGDLAEPRALAAMPFGGRYRLIDFALSNMVNSGIKRVGVTAQAKYKSLMDHIGTGASWDLDRMQQGLYLLPPYLNAMLPGDLSYMTGVLDYLDGSLQKYVVISESNVVMNTSYRGLVQQHIDTNADVTVMFNRDGIKFGPPAVSLDIDRRGQIKDVLIDAEQTSLTRTSLGVIVLSRDLYMHLLREAIARGLGGLTIETILRNHTALDIRAFEYKGLSLRINSVASYFKTSMRLLDKDVREDLFSIDSPIYTKVKNEAPALFAAGSDVSKSLCSDGCQIHGKVENSILFRGVQVGTHATIENSIIFQDVQISNGVELKNVIIDKNCVVRRGVRLLGQPDYPVVIGKGAIV